MTRVLAPWVTVKTYGGLGRLEHRGDLPWYLAPVPRWWHRCWPQTRMVTGGGTAETEKCPCGGVRLDGHGLWIDRHTRRTPATEADFAKEAADRYWERLMGDFAAAEALRDGARMAEIRGELVALHDLMYGDVEGAG